MLAPQSADPASPAAIDRILPHDTPELSFQVQVVGTHEPLAEHRPAWERLVETALEPNVFYEPSLLLPAVTHLAADDRPKIVLIYARQSTNHEAAPVLCGMFPLIRSVKYARRRWPGVTLWLHVHCFLGTPLVRGDCAQAVLNAFLDWLSSENGTRAIYLPRYHAGGRFGQCLTTVMQQRGDLWFVREQLARTQFEPAADAEEYLLHVWSRKTRQQTRRLKRGLEAQGKLVVRKLDAGEDVQPWIDRFLDLEAAGWKGSNGSAFSCHAQQRAFFIEALTAAHANQRLHMLALELDGRPIAMNCALFTADGGYYFKIAHDESLARYSPGVVLEAEFVEVLHERPGLRWLDSCAEVNHPMIERLWDRRTLIQSAWLSTGRRGGDLLVGSLAALSGWEKLARKVIKPLYRKWIKRT